MNAKRQVTARIDVDIYYCKLKDAIERLQEYAASFGEDADFQLEIDNSYEGSSPVAYVIYKRDETEQERKNREAREDQVRRSELAQLDRLKKKYEKGNG